MTGQNQPTTVGQLPKAETESPGFAPAAFTRLVWLLFVASLGLLAVRTVTGDGWTLSGVVAVDGLTVLMWLVVTFFGGVVHSYSRRYMAGSKHLGRFFTRLFAFVAVVMVLVAADHVALFALSWLAMGLVMADLIGHVRGWPQARAAAALARRYFLASSLLLGVGVGTLAWATGATTVSGIGASVDAVSTPLLVVAVGALLLAAMIQSALVPFHTWLLSSMTAPTPASALMHAGFVNAGGILLLRFAPVVTVDASVTLLIVVVGATSALAGKLLKTVQSDIKRQLGCSTVGQMGFMIMQAGLGFFGAAITHLILHGFYKAYQFLSSGSQIERTPTSTGTGTGSMGVLGVGVGALTAVAGGVLFAGITGKGTSLDAGLVLTTLVVLTTWHAARETTGRAALPTAARFGSVPLLFLPAIAVYGATYRAVEALLAGVPVVTAPAELTAVHVVVAAAYVVVYLAVESGVYERSQRLYVALLNAGQPPSETLLTSTEDYNEY
jgi:NAD(P)H-quinone oxidoreductase subunit 5